LEGFEPSVPEAEAMAIVPWSKDAAKWKIPRIIFSQKMSGKIGIFCGKCLNYFFPEKLRGKFHGKLFSAKKCTKNRPQAEKSLFQTCFF
jgi:hypothetical protein